MAGAQCASPIQKGRNRMFHAIRRLALLMAQALVMPPPARGRAPVLVRLALEPQ